VARLNWSDAENASKGFGPGIYLCEVLRAEEGVSKTSGAPYFKVKLGAVAFGNRELCEDYLMLGGKGANIGFKKLLALGIPKGLATLDAHHLIGKRVYARVDEEEWTNDKGKTSVQLKVNIKALGSEMGYWPEASKPEGVIEPAAGDWRKSEAAPIVPGSDVDDTPF
jgi:hypothetical protein